jgi:hypothetical protein
MTGLRSIGDHLEPEVQHGGTFAQESCKLVHSSALPDSSFAAGMQQTAAAALPPAKAKFTKEEAKAALRGMGATLLFEKASQALTPEFSDR